MKNWIEAQQIGPLGYYLNTLHPADPRLHSIITRLEQMLLGESSWSFYELREKLNSLPPSVLFMLARGTLKIDIGQSSLRETQEEITKTFSWLTA